MKKYKQIIWDWNGTLLDDVELCVEVMNKLLVKYNLPTITTELYKEVFDFPVRDYYLKLGFDFEKQSFEDVGVEYIEEYEKIVSRAQLRKEIIEVVKDLNSRQCPQTVISARENQALHAELKSYGVLEYIDGAIGLNNHYASGKASNVCSFVEKCSLDKKQILIIGDTLHDLEVANMAGIDCLLLADGHHSSKRISEAGGILVQNITQLRKVLDL